LNAIPTAASVAARALENDAVASRIGDDLLADFASDHLAAAWPQLAMFRGGEVEKFGGATTHAIGDPAYGCVVARPTSSAEFHAASSGSTPALTVTWSRSTIATLRDPLARSLLADWQSNDRLCRAWRASLNLGCWT